MENSAFYAFLFRLTISIYHEVFDRYVLVLMNIKE